MFEVYNVYRSALVSLIIVLVLPRKRGLQEKPPQVTITEIPGKGRGVILQESVLKDTYIAEYKTPKRKGVYPRKERRKHEIEYTRNNEGCMILEVQTTEGWMCLDATRRHDSLGRLFNHAPAHSATIRPFKALFLEGKWRVGFVSTRDLEAGEELTWDYGCRLEGQYWLLRRKPTAAKEVSTLQTLARLFMKLWVAHTTTLKCSLPLPFITSGGHPRDAPTGSLQQPVSSHRLAQWPPHQFKLINTHSGAHPSPQRRSHRVTAATGEFTQACSMATTSIQTY